MWRMVVVVVVTYTCTVGVWIPAEVQEGHARLPLLRMSEQTERPKLGSVVQGAKGRQPCGVCGIVTQHSCVIKTMR